MDWRWAAVGATCFVVACAKGADPDTTPITTYNPTATAPTATATATMTAAGTMDDDGGDGSGMTSTSGAPATGGADSGSDADPQPTDGMYSDCKMASECVGLNTCVTILDQNGEPTDGYCSNNKCVDPSTECDDPPAGTTATKFCMNLTLNGEPDTVCALDCANGATCPNGMICWDLNGISICA